MIDMAKRDGLEIDPERLSAELGVPVVPTVAVRKGGTEQLRAALEALLASAGNSAARPDEAAIPEDISALQRRARAIAAAATVHESVRRRWSHALDGVALHPIAGPILLGALLFVMFQAVFAWSEAPIGWIEGLFARAQGAVMAAMPDGVLRSLIVDGIIAGVGSVVVFLPQILILFLFILLLEASGYMVRAAS
jgi:ferrous iron transport protein B